MEKSYRYLPYYFALFFIIVIACFYRTYFGYFPDFKGIVSPFNKQPITITIITHFHASMIVSWLLLLIIQPILIIKKQRKWHKILGKASYFIVSLMFLSFVLIILQNQTNEKSLPIFAANLFDVPVFMALYSLAIYYRKNSAYHARFMVMSIIPFMNPALARIQVDGLGLNLGLWAILFLVEWRTRKVYKPLLIGFGYYIFNFCLVAYLFFANQPMLDKIWNLFF